MQLFHEIYGNYYNTIAAILDQAIRSKVSVNEIEKIVEEKAFCESGFIEAVPKKKRIRRRSHRFRECPGKIWRYNKRRKAKRNRSC